MKKNILLFLIFSKIVSWAQAPNISYPINTDFYPNDQGYKYATNTAMNPLIPVNIGGPLPNAIYGQVSTVAGIGIAGAIDGISTAASFNVPSGVAVDALGNLYVADRNNHKIRKITPLGVVSTLAGSGVVGAIDGVGTAASFNDPIGVAVDATGNVYVVDRGNHKIRKISTSGLVSTFAGSGVIGASDGIGSEASFNLPFGITIDLVGNLFVADTFNNKIRKITSNGLVSTFAIGITYPRSVAVDAQGMVYVTDASNIIKKVSGAGVVSSFAGNGVAGAIDGVGTAASFNVPIGVAVDALGNLYVADRNNHKIRKITPLGVVSTLAGSGVAGAIDGVGTAASFNQPSGVAVDTSGNLYVADMLNHKIRKITVTGYFIEAALPPGLSFNMTNGVISGTPTTAMTAAIYTITACNAFGNSSTSIKLSFVDKLISISYPSPKNYAIGIAIPPLSPTIVGRNYEYPFTTIKTLASFNSPLGVVIDANHNIYTISFSGCKIMKIAPTGIVSTFAGSGVPGSNDGIGTAASFNFPQGIAIDLAGNLYVADSGNHKIRKVTPSGLVSTLAGSGVVGAADGIGTVASFYYPQGVTVDLNGIVYVADFGNNIIRKITPSGVVSTLAGSGVAGAANGSGTAASFNHPTGVTVDRDGYYLYVCDSYNNKIRKITNTGYVTSYAGSGNQGSSDGYGSSASFNQLKFLKIDCLGNVYVADSSNNVIRKIVQTANINIGLVSTVSTQLGQGFNSPTDVAVDGIGSLYVSDFNNGAIKRIVPPYIITPCLPLGLNFDTNTGIISGTPTEATPATTYTVTTTYNGNPYIFNEVSSTTIVISTYSALGIDDFSKNNIKLYPNPTNAVLNLSVNGGIIIDKITILDITGKIHLEQTENLSTINLEKLAKGVYILTAYAGDKKYQEKFIKE